MASFKYVIQDPTGRNVGGIVDTQDRAEALLLFQERNYHVVSIDNATFFDISLQRLFDFLSGISRENVILFTRQLSTLIHSGLPLAQALESLAWQERNQKFRIIIETIKSDIEKGKPFSEGLARYPRLFSTLYVGMIEAGEASGLLDEILTRLAQLGLQELEIRTKIRSALSYPIILVCISILVLAFLLIGAIPKFLDIFKATQAELPLATLVLLGVSQAVRQYWYLVIAGIAAAVFLVDRFYKTQDGKVFFDRLKLKFPIFGEIYTKIIVARITRSIGSLIKSGIPLLQALEITKSMGTNSIILNALDKIQAGVSQGKTLTELFQKSGIFPPMVVQMVSVGETTGKLDEMFSEIASFYELEIDYFLRNLSSSLEPILLLMMGVMVGFIALAVLMPVFNLVKVFRQG
jgi:type IV pilus assembly protein PilC